MIDAMRGRFFGVASCALLGLSCSLSHDVGELDRLSDQDTASDDVSETSACGRLDAPCCASGSRCDVGLACNDASGTCVSCGAADQACCPGTKPCGDWLQCTSGKCAKCGGNPQPCCPGSLCQGTLSCIAKTCVRAAAAGDGCCEEASCATKGVCTEGKCCCGGTGLCDACTGSGLCKVCCITCDSGATASRPSCTEAASFCGVGKVKKTEWMKTCP